MQRPSDLVRIYWVSKMYHTQLYVGLRTDSFIVLCLTNICLLISKRISNYISRLQPFTHSRYSTGNYMADAKIENATLRNFLPLPRLTPVRGFRHEHDLIMKGLKQSQNNPCMNPWSIIPDLNHQARGEAETEMHCSHNALFINTSYERSSLDSSSPAASNVLSSQFRAPQMHGL